MSHPKIHKMSRRIMSAVLTALMLIPMLLCAPKAQAAPVPDGTTSTISIYRWNLIKNPNTSLRDGHSAKKVLTTWNDNNIWYYWRGYQSTWEGSYYEGKLILKDNLVSSQPVMEEAVSSGSTSFITTTDMGIRLNISAYKPEVFIYDGSSGTQSICYNYTNSTKASGMNFDALSKDDDGFGGMWLPQEGRANYAQDGNGTLLGTGLKFRSYAEYKPDKGYTYLRHNGNVIYASKSGDSNSAMFDTIYVAEEVKINAIQSSYSIADGQVLPVENTIYIPKGVTLTVKNGGALSVGGLLLNDGKIVVEKGGLLVVKTGAAIMPLTRTDTGCGGLVSDGTVVVRKNAKLIGGGITGLWFSSGGVTNFGMIASENFRATQLGIIENRTGGQIYAGKTIGGIDFHKLVCGYLDKKTPAGNSTIGEDTFQTKQPSGSVLLLDNAITNKGGTFKNFGSFGTQGSSVVNVYVESDAYDGMWDTAVTAYDSEMGYYQSEEMHVTVREYLDATGATERLRGEYSASHGSEEGFEAFLEEQIRADGKDPDSWVSVNNGIFTVNGRIVYTVPWYRQMQVMKDGDILQADSYPWQVKAVWGDGARPDDAPDEFADAALLDKTFFVELASAPGMRLEVAGGGVKDGDNVRIWSAQDADHMRWSFRKGEVLYRNGEKLYYYYIVNLKSGMVMHITSGTYAAEGQNIRQSDKKNAPYQQLFRVEQNSDGTYRIIPRGSDTYAMETNNGGTSNGSNVQVGVAGGDAARWKLIQTEESPYVGKIFEIEPVCAPDMRLEIRDGSTYYGADTGNAQIGAYNPDAAHQRWRFDKAEIVYENGEMLYYYYLVPTQWKHQLTTANLPAAHGNNVYQGKANGNTARQWRIVDNGDGTVGIVPRTNGKLRLHVNEGAADPGTNVNVWNYSSDTSQKWWVFPVGGSHPDAPGPEDSEPVNPASASAYDGKTFEFEPFLASGMRMEIQDASTGTGAGLATLQLGTRVPDAQYQTFRFSFAENADQDGKAVDYYYIIPVHSGHLLTTASLTSASGDNVYQAKTVSDGTIRQQWSVIENEDGTVSIAPRTNSGLRVSAYTGKNDPGTNINLWSATGDALDKWWMIPTGTTPEDHGSDLPDLSSRVFEIESAAAPGKVLEVMDAMTTYGGKNTRVQLADDTDMAHQRWRFVYAETEEKNGEKYDYYYLIADHSGHAMMPDSTDMPAAGTHVMQYKLGMYSDCEKWRVVNNGDGTYGLVTKLARGTDELRLALEGGGTGAGTLTVTSVPDGSAAQAWKLNPVTRPTYGDETEPPRAEIDNRVFEIESAAAPGMVIGIADAATAVNSKAQLETDTDQTHQRWRFAFAESVDGHDYYYIIAEHSGQALTPDTCNGVRPGTSVIQYTWKRFPEFQKWRVIDNGDGTYGLAAKVSQGYFEPRLSLMDGGTAAGTEMIAAEHDGSAIQKWKLNPVE